MGVWFHQFLSDRTLFVRLPGGVSKDSPVLSGVPQGNVLGPLLFIMIFDINKEIISSKIISFADDTRVYSNITHRVGNLLLLGNCPFGLEVTLIFKCTEASWEGTKATFHPSPVLK